ncbi:MAG: hypothetical protein HY738_02010, partial [Bacteroidia bacterium]|nr:hypothetical protein [Bacteroidia bacterium]
YCETIERFKKLFRIKPSLIVCDMHPDYLSTKYAEEQAQSIKSKAPSPKLQVQSSKSKAPSPKLQVQSSKSKAPATSYQLPATSYQLPTTNYQLPTTNYNYQNIRSAPSRPHRILHGGA